MISCNVGWGIWILHTVHWCMFETAWTFWREVVKLMRRILTYLPSDFEMVIASMSPMILAKKHKWFECRYSFLFNVEVMLCIKGKDYMLKELRFDTWERYVATRSKKKQQKVQRWWMCTWLRYSAPLWNIELHYCVHKKLLLDAV